MLQQQQEYLHQQLLECQLKVYEELENSTTEGMHAKFKNSKAKKHSKLQFNSK